MTIEELKAEWENHRDCSKDCDYDFRIMDKLIAVAEAAERSLEFEEGAFDAELPNALDDLLGEK